MNTVVSASRLTKKFGDFTAVDGISFEIREGECFGFLGPNGAGKTSTIRMIHCVSPVTSGAVTVFGEKAHINNRNIKKITGIIPQEITLDNGLTVEENLMVFSHFYDMPRQEAKRRVAELLDFMELAAKRRSRIEALSTGMKRRLLIARALLHGPRLIVADEPTTGLDPQARHLIWQRLRRLKDQGVTLVLTTQYMEEAHQLCDRLVIMDKAKIHREGAPRDLVKKEIGREVVEIRMQGGDPPVSRGINPAADEGELKGLYLAREKVGDTIYFYCDDSRPLMQKILEMGIHNVLNRPATLEDVFLKLTGRGLRD